MFKDYTKRIAICLTGLAICGLGNFFGVKAGEVGTNSWNSLAIGIANFSGLSFGGATLAISMAVIAFDLIGRGKFGIGTILNAILIPVFSDVFLNILSFVPEFKNTFSGIVSTLLGQILISFGTVLYMSAALGCGPRDTLMVLLGQKLPKLPIGLVRFCLEFAVLIIGMLMGAPFGLGTVAVMILQASMFQFACNVCHFEPRNVKNEDVIDSYKRIRAKSVSAI